VDGLPRIAPVITPDRWLIRGEFHHAKHAIVACKECHTAATSHQTSDILIPSKKSCTECHSPQGGVAQNCSTCHSYHTVHAPHAHQHVVR
jgi:hypothetical protein